MEIKTCGKYLVLAIVLSIFSTSASVAFGMYDPQLMRFTGRDPVKGDGQEPITLHKYLYCGNEPINRIDPKGEMIGDAIVAAFAVHEAAIIYTAYGVGNGVDAFVALGIKLDQMMLPVMAIALASQWNPVDKMIYEQDLGVKANYEGGGWNKLPGGKWVVIGTALVLGYEVYTNFKDHMDEMKELFKAETWKSFFRSLDPSQNR
jgi:hypothetical protein